MYIKFVEQPLSCYGLFKTYVVQYTPLHLEQVIIFSADNIKCSFPITPGHFVIEVSLGENIDLSLVRWIFENWCR